MTDFEIGLRMGTLQRMLDIAVRALKEIANEDYRGNKPSGAVEASKALEEISKLNMPTIEFRE